MLITKIEIPHNALLIGSCKAIAGYSTEERVMNLFITAKSPAKNATITKLV